MIGTTGSRISGQVRDILLQIKGVTEKLLTIKGKFTMLKHRIVLVVRVDT